MADKSRIEQILKYGLGEISTLPPNLSRIEELLVALIEQGGSGEGGTTNYNALTNKPSIEGTTLQGDMSLSQLDIQKSLTFDALPTMGSNNPVRSNGVYVALENKASVDSIPDMTDYYNKTQTDNAIIMKLAEIIADAPEDFDTLKEISDWISSHEDSAAAMNSAIQENARKIENKVDKVSGKVLSDNNYSNEEKTKLAGLENYDDSDLKSEIAVLTETGVKNLLKNNYAGQTYTNNGITFVSDEDGVISVSGTAGSDSGALPLIGTFTGTKTVLDCSDGDYILSVESATDNIFVNIYDRTTKTDGPVVNITGNGSQTFSGKITCVLLAAKTGTFENDTIKIMIRRAGTQDETFRPYAMSNSELTTFIRNSFNFNYKLMGAQDDFDDYTENGIYNNGGTNEGQTNYPKANTNGWLIVLKRNDANIVQIFFSLYSPDVFVRMKSRGTWGEWKRSALYS